MYSKTKLERVLELHRGYDLPERERKEGNVPIISSSGYSGLHNDCKCDGENVITGRYGTIGEVFYHEGKCWPLNTALYVSDFKENNPKYVYYLLKYILKMSIDGKDKSTVPGVDRNVLHQMEIPFCQDIKEQKELIRILEKLDERIDLNRKINDNLSAQMRAYFKEYTANNASITGKLKDYSVMQYGYTETATTEPVGPKFLRITDIAQNYIDWNGVPYCPISEENHKKYVLSEGDVVVARTGATVGYAKMVGRNIPDSVFASFLVRIRPIDVEYRYYFGLAITSAEFLDFVQTNAGGSAQPQANPPLLGEFELSIPNKQSLSEFNKKISSFLGVIETNETEISKLHEVKDTMVKMLSSR